MSSPEQEHPIRTVLLLEEPNERDHLRGMLRDVPSVEIVGEGDDCDEGVCLIRERRPDLLITEVILCEHETFGMIDDLRPGERPEVVFISRFREYAAKAFDRQAIDYIVRPCTPERLGIALRKVELWFSLKYSAHNGLVSPDSLKANPQSGSPEYLDRLVVKTRDRIYFVRTRDIEWIEAAADYVHVYALGRRHIIRAKISDLERRLDPAQFVRIHRSSIVQIDHVSELRPMYHGEFQVVLTDRTELTMSRGYRSRFSQFLGNIL